MLLGRSNAARRASIISNIGAPNRKWLTFDAIPYTQLHSNYCQVVLYEGNNVIDNHIIETLHTVNAVQEFIIY